MQKFEERIMSACIWKCRNFEKKLNVSAFEDAKFGEKLKVVALENADILRKK